MADAKGKIEKIMIVHETTTSSLFKDAWTVAMFLGAGALSHYLGFGGVVTGMFFVLLTLWAVSRESAKHMCMSIADARARLDAIEAERRAETEKPAAG